MRKMLAAGVLALTLLLSTSAIVSSQGGGTTTPPSEGNPDVKVWVNTPTKVYHCPGSRYYGKTKAGAYMTQKEAQTNGNHPAAGKVCQ